MFNPTQIVIEAFQLITATALTRTRRARIQRAGGCGTGTLTPVRGRGTEINARHNAGLGD